MKIVKLENLTSLDKPYVFCHEQEEAHYHAELEIMRIMHEGIVSVNNVDYEVVENDLLFINPNVVHECKGDVEFESILCNLNSLGLHQMDVIAKKYIYPIYTQELIFLPVIKDYNILNIVTQIQLTMLSKDEFYELELNELFYLLFHELFKSHLLIENKDQNVLTLEKVATVLNYIENHYQENLTIDDLANICGLSRSHFMKVFKERTGTSCNEYLIDYRLKKSLEMLEFTEIPIRDIIQLVGFRNISNFNRLFKKKYQTTPEKYRLSKRKKR